MTGPFTPGHVINIPGSTAFFAGASDCLDMTDLLLYIA